METERGGEQGGGQEGKREKERQRERGRETEREEGERDDFISPSHSVASPQLPGVSCSIVWNVGGPHRKWVLCFLSPSCWSGAEGCAATRLPDHGQQSVCVCIQHVCVCDKE